MKIILCSDIPSLGEEGEIKVVADGYARNYLLPQKLAVRYAKAAINELEQKKQSINRRKQEKAMAVANDKTKIESMEMDIELAAGKKGKLFGSVTSSTIMEFLGSRGITVERKHIELPENGIKFVGTHIVIVNLYSSEKAVLKVNVSALGEPHKYSAHTVSSESEAVSDDTAIDPKNTYPDDKG